MIACVAGSIDICPDIDQCHEQILAMLPRGRAWATEPGGVRWSFFRGLAALVADANAAICQLFAEVNCSTTDRLRPEWLQSYALPAPCDLYPDLCTKVAATGGQSCAYLSAVAADRGWDIECIDLHCAEADCAEADCSEASSRRVSGVLAVIVHMATSPAAGGVTGTNVEADCLEASQPIVCADDISSLECLMDIVAPAHCQIKYIIQ